MRQTIFADILRGARLSDRCWCVDFGVGLGGRDGGGTRGPRRRVGREEVGLAFIFLSRAHLADAESAVEAVRMELAPRHLLGCVAEGVVAGARELEEGPAAAVWAGALPGAEIECFHAAIV